MQGDKLVEVEDKNKLKWAALESLSKTERTLSMDVKNVLAQLKQSFVSFPDLFSDMENSPKRDYGDDDVLTQCGKVLSCLFRFGNRSQSKELLEILYHHKLYNLISTYIADIDLSQNDKNEFGIFVDFYLAHLDDPQMLAMGPKQFLLMSDAQSAPVLSALRAHSEVCPAFLKRLKSPTEKGKIKQLVALFLSLSADKGLSLADGMIQLGFLPFAAIIIPMLTERSQQLELLKDVRMKFTLDQVESILSAEKNPPLDYLNALAQRITYATRAEQMNPTRSSKFCMHLMSCYQLDSCEDSQKIRTVFYATLGSPITHLLEVSRSKSIPLLVALFKQFYVLDVTKRMFFLRLPRDVVTGYLSANAVDVGAMTSVQKFYQGHTEGEQLRSSKSVFEECCKTLAVGMDDTQACEMLQLLIDDKELHVLISALLSQLHTNGKAIEGYEPIYRRIMSDPTADPALKALLSPFGGVMAEKMSAENFSMLIDQLIVEKRYNEIRDLLMKCRNGGARLPDYIVTRLRQLFINDVANDKNPPLKAALYPEAFSYLSDVLIPQMTVSERAVVLADESALQSKELVQALCSETVFPLLTVEQRKQLLADTRISLSVSQVNAILENERKSDLDYLNALAKRTVYKEKVEQISPHRPVNMIMLLGEQYPLDVTYQAPEVPQAPQGAEATAQNAAQDGDKQLFEGALHFPLHAMQAISRCQSAPVLLALFEQFTVLEVTKQMYFFDDPFDVADRYFKAGDGHPGRTISFRDKKVYGTGDLKEGSKLRKERPVFETCCPTLQRKMNAAQANQMLALLINDKALVPLIPKLLSVPSTNPEALKGYVPHFVKALLELKSDADLVKILVPFSGVLIEQIDAEDLSLVISKLVKEKRYAELRTMLMNCRDGGRKLSPAVAKVLCQLFIVEVERDRNPELKDVLFPETFAHLCPGLMPQMTKEQRVVLLNDPVVTNSINCVQALCLADVFPGLDIQQRLKLLEDARVRLPAAQVDAILANVQTPPVGYLNALAQRIWSADKLERMDFKRPPRLIQLLAADYSLEGLDRDLFTNALISPIAHLTKVSDCQSASVLLALFEQFALVDVTKQMYFLQRPWKSVKEYLDSTPVESGKSVYFGGTIYDLDSLREGRPLSQAKPVFEACCETLAKTMTEKQATRLLQLLMSDPALHSLIDTLLKIRITNVDALRGYVPHFLTTLSDPNCAAGLKKPFLAHGGFLLEVITVGELSDFFNQLILEERYTDLTDILMGCRNRGKQLSAEVAKRLCDLFIVESKNNPKLKSALFPQVFTHLCAGLVPQMTEEERVAVLNDPATTVSVAMVEALVPANGEAPVQLSDQCKRSLVLRGAERSKEESKPVLRHLLTVFSNPLQEDLIFQIFVNYLRDEAIDQELRKKLAVILLEDHFLQFLPLLLTRVQTLFVSDAVNIQVLDFFDGMIATQPTDKLHAVLSALLDGLSNKAEKVDVRFQFIITRVFAQASLHKRLFEETLGDGRRKNSLFAYLLDKLIIADLKTLEPIINYLIDNHRISGQHLILFMESAMGILSIDHHNQFKGRTPVFRPELIQAVLTHYNRGDVRELIIKNSNSFLHRCCEASITDSIPHLEITSRALNLFLQFGCRPAEAYCAGGADVEDVHDPFHVAVISGQVVIISALMPYLRVVRPSLLRRFLNEGKCNLPAFTCLFDRGMATNPNFIKDNNFQEFFELCSYGLNSGARAEIFLYLVEQGIEPVLPALTAMMLKLETAKDEAAAKAKKDSAKVGEEANANNEDKKEVSEAEHEEYIQRWRTSLATHTPNVAVAYAIEAKDAALVEAIVLNPNNRDKFNRQSMDALCQWAVANELDDKTAPEFFEGLSAIISNVVLREAEVDPNKTVIELVELPNMQDELSIILKKHGEKLSSATIKVLVEWSAAFNKENEELRTVIDSLADNALLKEAEADPDTALFKAVEKNRQAMVKTIVVTHGKSDKLTRPRIVALLKWAEDKDAKVSADVCDAVKECFITSCCKGLLIEVKQQKFHADALIAQRDTIKRMCPIKILATIVELMIRPNPDEVIIDQLLEVFELKSLFCPPRATGIFSLFGNSAPKYSPVIALAYLRLTDRDPVSFGKFKAVLCDPKQWPNESRRKLYVEASRLVQQQRDVIELLPKFLLTPLFNERVASFGQAKSVAKLEVNGSGPANN